jgi:hypothetical protein
MRRLLTGLLGVTLLVSACGDDDDGDRSAVTSIPERSTTTSTTTTAPAVPPPDVIPEDVSLITEEYVEQVLNALYEVSLEALLLAREEGLVDQPSIELAESIRTPEHALEAVNSLIEIAAEGFPGYRENPGPTTADVRDVIIATNACVFAEVEFDSSETIEEPAPPPPELRAFVELRTASSEQRTSGNPTAWVVAGLPTTLDGTVPPSGCDDAAS